MGTKNNPGAFDCYHAAHPDEPMFILLGRDLDAPLLVRLWAHIRRRCGERAEKVVEAETCAKAMERWAAGIRADEPISTANRSRGAESDPLVGARATTVLTWIGFWRDKIPAEAMAELRTILGVPSTWPPTVPANREIREGDTAPRA